MFSPLSPSAKGAHPKDFGNREKQVLDGRALGEHSPTGRLPNLKGLSHEQELAGKVFFNLAERPSTTPSTSSCSPCPSACSLYPPCPASSSPLLRTQALAKSQSGSPSLAALYHKIREPQPSTGHRCLCALGTPACSCLSSLCLRLNLAGAFEFL
jgi:hypothetical protein